jgi:cell shape-determining protein MreC
LKKKNYGTGDMKSNSQRLFRSLKPSVSNNIFIFTLCSFLLFIYAVKHEIISFFVFDKLNALFSFVERPVVFAKDQWAKVTCFVKSKQDLAEEIEKLKQTIDTYKKQTLEYKDLQRENEYLASVLPLIKALNIKTITVVQKPDPSQPFVSTSLLANEFAEEVAVGNAVLSEHGLFGRVIFKRSKEVMILLATNLQSRIPVVSSKSKKKAVLFGKNSNYLKIKYVEDSAEEHNHNAVSGALQDRSIFFEEEKRRNSFIEGEILETSDEGGFFPRSIPVARIEKDSNGNVVAKWLCSDEPSSFITIAINR